MSIFNGVSGSTTNISALAESVIQESESMEWLEEGVFKYTASMVPVAMRETTEGNKYIVEYDMVKKLAAHTESTVLEAFTSICEENCISESDTYVLFQDPDMVIGEAYDSFNGTDDAEDSALYESKIFGLNDDIMSLKEANINMLKTDYLTESEAAFPNAKVFWRSIGNGFRLTEAGLKKSVQKALDNYCKTRADYVFMRRHIILSREGSGGDSMGFDRFKEDKWYDEKIAQCQKFIDANPAKTEAEKKAEKQANKDAKQSARDAKKAEKAARKNQPANA